MDMDRIVEVGLSILSLAVLTAGGILIVVAALWLTYHIVVNGF